MKIKKAELAACAVETAQYPTGGLGEVALVGRSNVGKSSLINTLVTRKNLARTSSAPGKTRTVNFYLLNETFHLVDLPGFGYAKVPMAERRRWKEMVERYMGSREELRGVLVILDARREPGPVETELYRWLEVLDLPVVTVLTKCDKLSKNKLAKQLALIKRSLPFTEPVVFSAMTGEGKQHLGRLIYDMVRKNEGEATERQ